MAQNQEQLDGLLSLRPAEPVGSLPELAEFMIGRACELQQQIESGVLDVANLPQTWVDAVYTLANIDNTAVPSYGFGPHHGINY